MEFLFPIVMIGQVVLLVCILAVGIRSYWSSYRSGSKSKTFILLCNAALSGSMVISFAIGDESGMPFSNEPYYLLFAVLSLGLLAFYWLIQFDKANRSVVLTHLKLALLGMFFWIAVGVVAKFNFLIFLSFFPFYGFLVATPFLLALFIGSEIVHQSRRAYGQGFLKSIVMGGVVLISFQLALNTITVDSWVILDLFKTNYPLFD